MGGLPIFRDAQDVSIGFSILQSAGAWTVPSEHADIYASTVLAKNRTTIAGRHFKL